MAEPLKIVIPMAGLGTRLRPHTWNKPKQLISVAGKTVLDHVLDTFNTLPDPEGVELIFIVGYLGDQIRAYMERQHPSLLVRYVWQHELKGQSDAIYLARKHLSGPMLMVFADTLIETDLSFLADEAAQAVAWVKPVPDPRRFGVAVVGPDGWVSRLVEKPQSVENNLVVVGFYYFQSSEALLAAIEEQMRRGVQLKGEYFLADAVNIMFERGLQMRAHPVEIWLDAGAVDALLDTNRYLLDHGRDNSAQAALREGITVIPPVFIHPTAEVESAVIGPHVSIGADCQVRRSVLQDAILESGAQAVDVVLAGSVLGVQARAQGRASIINAGDHSVVEL